MHTTTFYSFKGGVGRTLALVNIGVEFANTGRRVLLVDFDLEAPGVDTFDELKAPEGQAGVVDFVTDYIKSGTPPNFANYYYRAALPPKDGGGLWVMPAGRRDSQYATKLAAIDWQHLYSEMDGFFLLEDLKEQWSEQLKPDYVLIDSRTGHTVLAGFALVNSLIPSSCSSFRMNRILQDLSESSNRSGWKISGQNDVPSILSSSHPTYPTWTTKKRSSSR